MGAFDQITNQRRAAAVLQRTILADRVSHAWLFCGPSASDMQALALAFAMTLQCTERPEDSADACMACRSCRQAMDGNHPDILLWNHEKAATFSVDEVRSLVQDVSIRPFGGGRKIYIVPDAHLMRPEAQNALLKTLEEPPEYVVILLLSQSADAMLETVRSRCQMVELAAGRAGYEPAIRRIAEDLLLQVPGLELPGIRTAVKELEPFRLQAGQILELFATYCDENGADLAKRYGFNGLDNYKSENPDMDGNQLLAAQKLYKANKDSGKSVVAVFVADVSGSMDGEPMRALQ